jgi:hypothetical protein
MSPVSSARQILPSARRVRVTRRPHRVAPAVAWALQTVRLEGEER